MASGMRTTLGEPTANSRLGTNIGEGLVEDNNPFDKSYIDEDMP